MYNRGRKTDNKVQVHRSADRFQPVLTMSSVRGGVLAVSAHCSIFAIVLKGIDLPSCCLKYCT